MAEDHNPVFDLLEAGTDDIECLVAYSLYKRHKRQWAAEFSENHGRKPNQQEDAAFATAVCTKDQLKRYRQNAQDLIIAFANEVLEDERPEIEKAAITAKIEAAARTVSGSASFMKQLGAGLVSSLITTFVLIVLTIAIALFGVDPLDGVSSLINSDPTHAPISTEIDATQP